MLHIRKTLSKQERADYQEWLANHKKSTRIFSKEEREKIAETFWQRQARLLEQLSRPMPGNSGPSIEPAPEVKPLVLLEPEEIERREAEAQKQIDEKKLRTAPVYNKGGNVYWTEEMAKEYSGGGHRRR